MAYETEIREDVSDEDIEVLLNVIRKNIQQTRTLILSTDYETDQFVLVSTDADRDLYEGYAVTNALNAHKHLGGNHA